MTAPNDPKPTEVSDEMADADVANGEGPGPDDVGDEGAPRDSSITQRTGDRQAAETRELDPQP